MMTWFWFIMMLVWFVVAITEMDKVNDLKEQVKFEKGKVATLMLCLDAKTASDKVKKEFIVLAITGEKREYLPQDFFDEAKERFGLVLDEDGQPVLENDEPVFD